MLVWAVAQVAWGCGATVCDGGTATTPSTPGTTTTGGTTGGGPILQTGERILFQQESDGWTAFVQIQTAGADSKFGWVIPVPLEVDPADVEVAPDGLMDDLEQVTAPRFRTDQGTVSGAADPTASGCDCGAGVLDELLLDAGEVLGSAVVGPYEVTSLRGDDAAGLATWFLQGGYNVPLSAYPLIDDYVSRGYSFVAVRMLPLAGAGQGTAQTLKIPCGQDAPSIPITLTSVAAVADMSITAYVLADHRYEPGGDWPEVAFDPTAVTASGGTTDYAAQLGIALDDQGGAGFRTEFAAPIEAVMADLSQETKQALGSGAYLTRLQTWVSPQEMLTDPVFLRAAEDAADVDNVIDLRSGGGTAGAGLLAPLLLGLAGVFRRRSRRRA
ncbi:MAG: DUF2330 domain-containing protein [Myxococcota bacterium]